MWRTVSGFVSNLLASAVEESDSDYETGSDSEDDYDDAETKAYAGEVDTLLQEGSVAKQVSQPAAQAPAVFVEKRRNPSGALAQSREASPVDCSEVGV